MSQDLQWLLVRKWNSFMHVSKTGRNFTKEPGNLTNFHSQKYSGITNSKSVGIHANEDGQVVITKIKADVKPNQVAGARVGTTLKRGTGPRRANKIAAAETAGKGYRGDLRQAAVARASAYARVQKLTANPPKTFPIKTRGPNSKKSTSEAKADDVIELD
eukprot:Opistho-1_new@102082